MGSSPHHFVFVLYPEVSLSSLTGTMEVLEQAMLEQGLSGGSGLSWRISLVSSDGARTSSYFGVTVETRGFAALDGEPPDTIFVSGGLGFRAAMADGALLGWLRANAPAASRICASGTGSFILAQAGLLDRHKIVTHWLMNEEFAEAFPEVELIRDRIYVNDGRFWTSAGMGSAVDFALALLEEDAGRDFAFRVAKRALIMLRRSGEQPQISSVLQAQAMEGDRFDRLHEWIYANLKSDLSIERLAARVGMSQRNFSRVYHAKLGMTPGNKVTQIRLEAAREALLHSDARISTIAWECGFHDEQQMRRAFLRWTGQSPSDIRAGIGKD
jgi:transcriptional regulator GlxA family with amidase domain